MTCEGRVPATEAENEHACGEPAPYTFTVVTVEPPVSRWYCERHYRQAVRAHAG